MDGPRACRDSEFMEVLSFVNRIFREGTDQEIRTDYPLVFDRSKLEYIRILKEDNKVVSVVPIIKRGVAAGGDTLEVGIISPTGTHPDYRRKGYGTLCVRDCVRIMEEENCPVSSLWTQVQTFPFYRHSGFEAVSSQGWGYNFQPGDQGLFKDGPFDVTCFNPSDDRHLDSVMEYHEAEPYRIKRTRQEYRVLLSLPKITTYLATREHEVSAYLSFGEGVNKPGIIEAGGCRDALESLLRHTLLTHGKTQEIHAVVPLTATVLSNLLEEKKSSGRYPVEEADGVGPQMMRINSLGGLLRGITHFFESRSAGLNAEMRLVCGETGESVTIKLNDGTVEFSDESLPNEVVLSRRDLTKLIFGPYVSDQPLNCDEDTGKALRTVFPYYFPIWELDHS